MLSSGTIHVGTRIHRIEPTKFMVLHFVKLPHYTIELQKNHITNSHVHIGWGGRQKTYNI